MKPLIHHLLSALLAIFVLAGCYDDGKVWDAIGDHQQRLDALESWQKTATGNIEALQVLLSGQDYITGITPVILGEDTVGFTIAFDAHAPVTLYNGVTGEQGARGEQGTAGATPAISVTRQEDGNWYWTLNGEPLTDDNGTPLRANGTDGQPGSGAPAPAPMLKTGAQLTAGGVPPSAGNLPGWTPGAVYLSVDGGATWAQVSGKPGKDNDVYISSVTPDPNGYDFTFNDGTVLWVKRYTSIFLDFAGWPGDYPTAGPTPVSPGELILITQDNPKIQYTVRGTGIEVSDVRVSARITSGDGWKANIPFRYPDSFTIDTITFTVPSGGSGTATVLITATDNAGHSCLYDLSVKPFLGGSDGSRQAPYIISCARELRYVAQQVNAGNTAYQGKYFILENDIDLDGMPWTPIGTEAHPFDGTFDGKGYRVPGLETATALFGHTAPDAVIRNILD